MKLKAAQEANIQCELRKLPETVTEATLLNDIDVLNDDPSVHEYPCSAAAAQVY